MSERFAFGLVGRNIAYSRSSEIFKAIFDTVGAMGRFEVHDVAPNQLRAIFERLFGEGLQAVSVTIPYKSRVLEFVEAGDTIATALGASNSVVLGSGGFRGFNTDCYGFSLALREHAEGLRGGRAVILGNGGGAKAAVYGCARTAG